MQPQAAHRLRMRRLIRASILANLLGTCRSSDGYQGELVGGMPRLFASRRGLTILELVIALFMIGVILGLSLPLASTLAGRFKVGSARDVFVNYYARTRATAVQYGREARLHIDAVGREFWVEVDTGVPGATATDTIGVVLNVGREYGGVTMNSFGKQVLCFDSRGLPATGDAQCDTHDAKVVFEKSSRSDTVEISLGGTVVNK